MIRIVQIIGGVDGEGNEMIVGLDELGSLYEYQREVKPRELGRMGGDKTYYSGWTAGWKELPNINGFSKEVLHPEDPRNGVREG